MIATCNGGPYDGMQFDHNDLNLHTLFQQVGTRKFFFMPARSEWDAVRSGEKNKNEHDVFHGQGSTYELIRIPTGFELQHDPDGSVFGAASREYTESSQPVPVDTTQWEYYRCHRGEEKTTLPDGYIMATDEKGREWKCYTITEAENNEFGGPMFTRIMVKVAVRNKAELIAHLSDSLD